MLSPTNLLRISAALALAAPGSSWAGAWTRDAGHLYVKAGGSFFVASRPTILSGRDSMRRASFSGERYSLYAEVGLGGGAQIGLSLPFSRNFNRFDNGTVARRMGLSDLGVTASYGIRRGKWALAFHGMGVLPLYERADEAPGLATLPDEPELGDGRFDLQLIVTLGRSFHPAPAWMEIDLGHRLRLGSSAGALVAAVRGGYTVLKRVMLMAELRTMLAYGVSDTAHPVVRPPDLLVFEPKILFRLWAGLALEVSVASAVPGASRDAGTFLSAALSFMR